MDKLNPGDSVDLFLMAGDVEFFFFVTSIKEGFKWNLDIIMDKRMLVQFLSTKLTMFCNHCKKSIRWDLSAILLNIYCIASGIISTNNYQDIIVGIKCRDLCFQERKLLLFTLQLLLFMHTLKYVAPLLLIAPSWARASPYSWLKLPFFQDGGIIKNFTGQGDAVVSWLVCSSPDRAVRVRALAGDIVSCSWARHSHSASLHPGV